MRTLKKIIALTLAIAMLSVSLVSCASKGKPLLKLEGESISINVFELYLSRMKGTLTSATLFGSSAKEDDFWDTLMDVYDKKTYNTHYTNIVLESAKTYLAALALFEERKLELPKEKIDEIDARLEEMVTNEANGSKTAFNAIIGEYGVNYEMLREAYIIEAKIEHLENDIFGENNSKVGTNLIDDYYKKNYARYKHIFLQTYEYQYVVDRNQDVMYFKDNGRIAYDTTKTKLLDDDGEPMLDENQDVVYVYTDDKGNERIAYDTVNGKTEIQTDGNGDAVINKYNATELEIVKNDRDAILAQVKAGDTLGFDVLVARYNQDPDVEEYPDGFYVEKNANHRSPELVEKIFSMEENSIDWVQTDYGIHIIMRCPLEDGAYASDEYKDLFISNSTGTYVFMDRLRSGLMTEYLEPYKSKIKVDEELLATVDIKRAGINQYY